MGDARYFTKKLEELIEKLAGEGKSKEEIAMTINETVLFETPAFLSWNGTKFKLDVREEGV